jgi:carboxymethylenebutenolidase
MIDYAGDGSTVQGYLAVPPGGTGPGVVVIQEWWGLVGHVKSVADRFAEAGYLALAPDLYHGVATTEPDEAARLLMGLALPVVARDIAGAADALVERGGGPRIGAVGFCMGGSLSLWSATVSERIVAAVGFYPGIPWERMSPSWTGYAGKAALIHCSEGDGTSSAPGIQAAVTAIRGAGGEVEVYDYPGTQHAFFNDDRPEVYDAEAAALARDRTLGFLAAHLR